MNPAFFAASQMLMFSKTCIYAPYNKAKKKKNKCFSGPAASLSDPPHYPFLLLKIKKNTETTAFCLETFTLVTFFRSRFSEKRLRMQSVHDG